MRLKIRSLRKLYTLNDELNRIQDSIKVALDPLLSDSLLDRQDFNMTITTTGTTIKHLLGRVPTGFIVYDSTINATLWRVSWTVDDITLQSSVDAPFKFFLY
jgi:hypothetical protein